MGELWSPDKEESLANSAKRSANFLLTSEGEREEKEERGTDETIERESERGGRYGNNLFVVFL